MRHNESLFDRPRRLCLRIGWDMLIHRGTFLFKYMLRVNATVSNKKSIDIVNYSKLCKSYHILYSVPSCNKLRKLLITTKGLRKLYNFQGLLQPAADFFISHLFPENVMLLINSNQQTKPPQLFLNYLFQQSYHSSEDYCIIFIGFVLPTPIT